MKTGVRTSRPTCNIRSGASINEIYRAAAPGVVQVSTTTTVTRPVDPFGSFFGFPAQQAQETAHALGWGPHSHNDKGQEYGDAWDVMSGATYGYTYVNDFGVNVRIGRPKIGPSSHFT